MKTTDDFNWDTYTTEYERQITRELEIEDKLDFIIKDFTTDLDNIYFEDNLHSNWKELYYHVFKLKPSSVFECGCGCAHHLINISKILPHADISGCDYSQSQIDLGYKHYNLDKYEFNKKLFVQDLTKSIDTTKKYEFVYTQAVMLHLSYERAKLFLANMARLSSKYIFFIENFIQHNFYKMVEETLPEFEIINNKSKFLDNNFMLLKRK